MAAGLLLLFFTGLVVDPLLEIHDEGHLQGQLQDLHDAVDHVDNVGEVLDLVLVKDPGEDGQVEVNEEEETGDAEQNQVQRVGLFLIRIFFVGEAQFLALQESGDDRNDPDQVDYRVRRLGKVFRGELKEGLHP